jgi:hypothetical protein
MTYGNSRDGIEEFRAAIETPVPKYVLDDFAVATGAKLDHGDAKYGADAWARHDMLDEALNEVIDLGNYAYLKWRQLRELECNPAIMVAMGAMTELYSACLPFYANLRSLQNVLDDAKVPRSLTTENFVGVQSHEPGETTLPPLN